MFWTYMQRHVPWKAESELIGVGMHTIFTWDRNDSSSPEERLPPATLSMEPYGSNAWNESTPKDVSYNREVPFAERGALVRYILVSVREVVGINGFCVLGSPLGSQ